MPDFRSNALGTIAPTDYPTLALKDGYQIFLIGEDKTKNIKPSTWDDILRAMNAPPNATAFIGDHLRRRGQPVREEVELVDREGLRVGVHRRRRLRERVPLRLGRHDRHAVGPRLRRALIHFVHG